MAHRFKIEDGEMEFIYDDRLASIANGPDATVTRASFVEPHPTGPGWLADMRPSGGPILGLNGEFITVTGDDDLVFGSPEDALIALSGRITGFPTRQAALDAERAWLREYKGV